MKKKTTALMAVLLSAGLLAGCGDKELANTDLHQMKVDNYVTLGDYSSLSVSVDPARVDDADWHELTLAVYWNVVTADNGGITDRAVEMGDTIILDYEGKQDGVAFAGGTAQGADLEIGSGSFIDGFEEGLVGVMPGETVDLDLTFPEIYEYNPDMAGAEVVFTVTVQFILPGEEAMEDSLVPLLEIEDVNTVEELRQFVYDYLMEEAESKYIYAVEDSMVEQLINGSIFKELPESFLDSYKTIYNQSLSSIASSYGVTVDDFTYYYYNMSSRDYVNTYSELQAKRELLMQAIANQEGLAVSDEELQQKLEEYAEEVGAGSVDVLLESTDQENYRNYFMTEKVMDYLMEQAGFGE